MDYTIYADKTSLANPKNSFPVPVGASASNPKLLYWVAHDLLYINTGSGWSELCQPQTSGSTYQTLPGTTLEGALNNLSSSPHPIAAPAIKKVSRGK
jgi:hypothetical protein